MAQSDNAPLRHGLRGRHGSCQRRFRVKHQFLQTGFPRYRSCASESKANVKLTKVFRRVGCVTPSGGSLFVKSGFDKFLQLLHCLVGIWSIAANTQLRTLPSRKHHQPHDAFSVYLFAFLRHPNFRAMTAGNAHKHRSWSRMQSKPIDDSQLLFKLLRLRSAVPLSIQQSHYVALFSSINRSNLVLKSTAAFCPKPFNFSSIAATSINRAMSRPGLTGIVTCGTFKPKIS